LFQTQRIANARRLGIFPSSNKSHQIMPISSSGLKYVQNSPILLGNQTSRTATNLAPLLSIIKLGQPTKSKASGYLKKGKGPRMTMCDENSFLKQMRPLGEFCM
jgi:hypothetical protein